ncbi:MAG TPA: 3-hydroxyacyl-CoA dehydrogenase family protein, partial [Candidatus Methylomirabilis sp.]
FCLLAQSWREEIVMAIDDVKRIAVVGAGAMGSQIAMVCALAGYEASVCDAAPEAVKKAEAWAAKWLDERVAKGRLTAEQTAAARKHLTYAPSLAAAAAQADFVIEAIIEEEDAKRACFAELDKICPPHAILATNSSSILSSRIADATKRPDKVLNMHFFNPAVVMELVEVMGHPGTSEESMATTMELSRRIGKTPVRVRKEIPAFIANRILHAVANEAMRLVEKGVATPEEVDLAVEKGLRYPLGPFRLMDLTGIDVGYQVRMARYRMSGDPADKPNPLLVAKYEKGEYGRKTGKGWYEYPEQKT